MSKNDRADTEQTPLALTVKDRRIIGALFDDGRMPFSAIGKRIRLSKESVNYRVKRLEREGLIVGYNTVIDVKRLGWEIFFVYFRFRQIDAAEEEKLLEHLNSHPHVAQLFKCMGSYDAVCKLFVKNYAELGEVIKNIEAVFGEQIGDYHVDYVLEETAVPFSFLYEGKEKQYFLSRQKITPLALAEIDIRILEQLAKHARISLAEISLKIKESSELVKYRLRKLEKSGIILKYRPDVMPKKLGYNWYLLVLKTGKLTPSLKSALTGFLSEHPNVTYYYQSVGDNDVQIEIRAKTNEKLNIVVMDIRGILKKVLKRSEILIILDEPKYTYFPDCLRETEFTP